MGLLLWTTDRSDLVNRTKTASAADSFSESQTPSQKMVKINIEGRLPYADEDADDGRLGADLPKTIQAMHAGVALDPDP